MLKFQDLAGKMLKNQDLTIKIIITCPCSLQKWITHQTGGPAQYVTLYIFALYCSDAKQWTVIKVHTGNSPMSILVPMQLQGFDLTGSQAQAL